MDPDPEEEFSEVQDVIEAIPYESHGESRSPTVFSHWATSNYAFPSDAAVFCHGFEWDQTPWIPRPHIDVLTLQKISDRAYGELNTFKPKPGLLHLGNPARSSMFNAYAVFPNLTRPIAATCDCKDLEKWTDEIVLPTLSSVLSAGARQSLQPSHKSAKTKSQAVRDSCGQDFGDTPITYFLQSVMFEHAWDKIVSATRQAGFEDFRDVFLVVVGSFHPSATDSGSFEATFKKTMRHWELAVDMQYVPRHDMEVRIISQLLI